MKKLFNRLGCLWAGHLVIPVLDHSVSTSFSPYVADMCVRCGKEWPK